MENNKVMAEKGSAKSNTAIRSNTRSRDVKLRVLRYLRTHGYSQDNLKIASEFRKQDFSDMVFHYVSNICDRAQESVEQECDSVSLNNITQWLELMKNAGLSHLCEFEAAAIVNSIVQNESQPPPENLEGINLKEAYKFLDKALMGQPQKELGEATQAFLSREIELLIAEANTDESDDVARSMGQSLYHQEVYDYMAHPEKCSRDPLFLDKDLEPAT